MTPQLERNKEENIYGKMIDIGTPQSGDKAAWFVLPDFLNKPVLEAVAREKFSMHSQLEWIEGRRESP